MLFSQLKLTNTPELRLGNQQFLLVWDFLPFSVKGISKGMVVGRGGNALKRDKSLLPPAFFRKNP